jgi:hypothetical protein
VSPRAYAASRGEAAASTRARPRATPVALGCAAALAGSGVSGCWEHTCVDRGSSKTYQGTVSYVGQAAGVGGAPDRPIEGTTSGALVRDDFDPFGAGSCDVDGIEFTVRLPRCELIAQETSERHDTGRDSDQAFVGATASVQSTVGSCTLMLAQGPAVVTDVGGTLQIGPTSVQLTLSGSVTTLGASAASGQLQWTFTGQ